MARSAIDKQIRKINDRMQKLYDVYGADSPAYQFYASMIQANKLSVNILADGRMQIRQGKVNANLNRFQRDALTDMIEGGATVGGLRAEARKYAAKTGRKGLSTEEIDILSEKIEYVKAHRDIITWISEQMKLHIALTDSMRELYYRAKGRSDEMLYEELYDMMVQAQADKEAYYD